MTAIEVEEGVAWHELSTPFMFLSTSIHYHNFPLLTSRLSSLQNFKVNQPIKEASQGNCVIVLINYHLKERISNTPAIPFPIVSLIPSSHLLKDDVSSSSYRGVFLSPPTPMGHHSCGHNPVPPQRPLPHHLRQPNWWWRVDER